MGYEVLARKWRPQQFDDVVGQRHVTDTLKNAIERDRVAHAYLFVGSRGIGKTTTARILAKALNCRKGPTPTPCDKCESCLEIMNGNSLDVIEIDGASNRGIDRVRELRENAQYAPARAPHKIYIIDEVHMLTTEAFNALLKTLEEPPPHVKFIFATTDPHRLLPTILSRCQRFDLRRISVKDMVGHLSAIAKGEKVSIDEDALLAIARGAEGGLRDAESALDQLIAFRGDTIREADVLSVFGLVARERLDDILTAILEGDVSRIVDNIAELDASGKDMKRLVVELIESFKNLLLVLYSGKDFEHPAMTESQTKQLAERAEGVDPGRVMQVLEILIGAESRLRFALSARTVLETELIRATRTASMWSIDEIIQRVESLADGGASEPPPKPTVETPKKKDLPVAPTPDRSPEEELDYLTDHWTEGVERIAKMAPLMRNFLLDVRPERVTSEHIVLGVDREFAGEIDNMDVGRNRQAVQRVLAEMLKRDVSVQYEPVEMKHEAVLETADPYEPESPESAPEEPEPKEESVIAKEWFKDKTVRQVCDLFNGSVTDVRA